MFCALLLRKAEAADLQLGDTEVSLDKLSGQILIVGGLHKYLFIHIKRSKTDHSDQGRELLISTTILSNFCVDNYNKFNDDIPTPVLSSHVKPWLHTDRQELSGR